MYMCISSSPAFSWHEETKILSRVRFKTCSFVTVFSACHLQRLPLSSQRMMGTYRPVHAFTALLLETVICPRRRPETLPPWYRVIDDTVTSLRNGSGETSGSGNVGWSPAAVWTPHPPSLWSNSRFSEWAQHESYYYTQQVSEESQSRTLVKTNNIVSLAKAVTLYKEDDNTNILGSNDSVSSRRLEPAPAIKTKLDFGIASFRYRGEDFTVELLL